MKIFLYIAILLAVPGLLFAGDYDSYSFSRKQIEYFEVQFSRSNDDFKIIGYVDSAKVTLSGNTDELQVSKSMVVFKSIPLFTDSSLELSGKIFLYKNISDCRIVEDAEYIKITFLTTTDQSRLARFKKGNRVTFSDNIVVADDDFVRGLVFTVTGKIEINGEVNKDVVSLLGDVELAPSAVVRGNLLTVTEKVKINDGATLYGEIYDNDKKGRGRKHRLFRGEGAFQVSNRIEYNRVDGLSLTGKLSHHDIDSLLPTVALELGYALASDRGRFLLQAEQVLLREPVLVVGGNAYKKLTSGDNHLISTLENSVYSVLFKEDYRDYYEATGGSVYMSFTPTSQFFIQTGYTYFESDWLRSHRHLWALFRKNSLFDYNFDSWQESERAAAITEVDSAAIGYLFSKVEYSSDSLAQNNLEKSHWLLSGTLEWSQTGLSSDFDYKKYSFQVQRFQRFSSSSIFLARVIHGNSDGYLPYFKRYYLGGLGTLQGYTHKEYMGTRFWMSNLEYRIKLPGSEFGVAARYDIGQIANETKLTSDIEIKQSAGISLFFEDDFKITLAKRLDRSSDDKLQLYVRFKHIF